MGCSSGPTGANRGASNRPTRMGATVKCSSPPTIAGPIHWQSIISLLDRCPQEDDRSLRFTRYVAEGVAPSSRQPLSLMTSFQCHWVSSTTAVGIHHSSRSSSHQTALIRPVNLAESDDKREFDYFENESGLCPGVWCALDLRVVSVTRSKPPGHPDGTVSSVRDHRVGSELVLEWGTLSVWIQRLIPPFYSARINGSLQFNIPENSFILTSFGEFTVPFDQSHCKRKRISH